MILFQTKVLYLYEQLKVKGFSESDFIKLFWNGDKKSLESRKKTIKRWLYNELKGTPKGFRFQSYAIADKGIDGNRFFTIEDFLDIVDFESFQVKADIYVNYINKAEHQFEYHYIYYFDRKLDKISGIEIKIIEETQPNLFKIEIDTLFSDIETYSGTLKIINSHYYYILVQNNFENLSFYFVRNRGYRTTNYIYGIGLGLSYEDGLPIASKYVLTKNRLTQEETNLLHIDINENETLLIGERTNNVYHDTTQRYRYKLNRKIKSLKRYMTRANDILSDEFKDDIYLNIFFQNLLNLNDMSKRVYENNYFDISNRGKAIGIFLNISAELKSDCVIVYPLFGKNNKIFFNHLNENSKKVFNENLKLAKEGLKITRILIVDSTFKITTTFTQMVNILTENGISVRVVFKEEIESLVYSYYFIFNQDKKIALYQELNQNNCFFNVTKDKKLIDKLVDDYNIILSKSFDFQDFLEARCTINHDKNLNALLGNWNFYFYGSTADKENSSKMKLWQLKINISADAQVKFIEDNGEIFTGIIDTTFNPKQSIITVIGRNANSTSILVFDNLDIIKKVFKATLIDKQKGTNLDFVSCGIFSKNEIEENLVKFILGDFDKVSFKEEQELSQKIAQRFEQEKKA